jgi:hypothetical protein
MTYLPWQSVCKHCQSAADVYSAWFSPHKKIRRSMGLFPSAYWITFEFIPALGFELALLP